MQVVMYLVFVFLFSSIFYFLMLRGHTLAGGGGLYVTGIMWCPALAAFATLGLNNRSFTDLGWKWPARKYAAMSWYVPLLYAGVAYLIVWILGLGGFPNRQFMQGLVARMGVSSSPVVSTVLYVLFTGSFGLVASLSRALGEEIGWRGFLVPELSKTTRFTDTALFSGIVWACWHYPILIWGDYNAGTPSWYGLTCFTVMVVAIAVVFAWVRLKSGSLWTGAILHASHNLYVQAIFTPLTADRGKTAWFIDEFGAVLPLITIVFAIYFWRRRRELSSGQATREPSSVPVASTR
jgi:membrane protease YdiL (CAAX protease family)